MNKRLKILLLAATVLKCGEVFASENNALVVVDNDLLERVRNQRVVLTNNVSVIVSRAQTIETSMVAKNQLISEVYGAISNYMSTLQRTYDLSNQVEQITSTFFARLNCDETQVRNFIKTVSSETHNTAQKEGFLQAILSKLDETAISEVLGRVKDSEATIKSLAEALSPARSDRAASENQPNNQFSPGAGSHGEGSVHDDNDEGDQNQL